MNYEERIEVYREDPEGLERLYREAGAGEAERFRVALEAGYARFPDNRLLAAWHYRLQPAGSSTGSLAGERSAAGGVNWPVAIGLSIVLGLIFALLSRALTGDGVNRPYFLLSLGPLSAAFIIAFLTLAGKLPGRRALVVLLGLAALTAYALWFGTRVEEVTYRTLMIAHLPLLAWIAVGLGILGWRSEPTERFAFLAKSIEVAIAGGLYMGVGGVVASITMGLFSALGITIPMDIMQTLIAGGGGLIPVLAVATIYDPQLSPLQQKFEDGLSRLLTTLLRLALPLTLLVLAVYICVIPFNFMQPFRNRDVLIVYNVMLFAVMGLLIGVTPVRDESLGTRQGKLLRAGLLALAGLTLLVSLYAMSATVYRTVLGGLTTNRLTIIGWNAINIGILALLLGRQVRVQPPAGSEPAGGWVGALHSALSTGTMGYIVWTVFLVVAIPWLF